MDSAQSGSASALCESMGREVIYQSVLITFVCIISIFNLIGIFRLAKLKKKKIYEIKLLSLSVSDSMFGLSNVIVSSIIVSNLCRFEELSESSYVLYLVFVLQSIFHLIFIAIDRIILFLKPLHHIITKKESMCNYSGKWDNHSNRQYFFICAIRIKRSNSKSSYFYNLHNTNKFHKSYNSCIKIIH